MKKRILFLLSIVGVGALSAEAQRTVTNADLEKFRQARLGAEADLRENYRRLGFVSPEVMAARNQESARATAELAEQLRAARIEQDRLAAEIAAARRPVGLDRAPLYRESPYDVDANLGITSSADFVYLGAPGARRFNGRVRHRAVPRQTEGYFAGGQFWPTGSRMQPMPVFTRPKSSKPGRR